ncbi:uncharacterized protein SOCEGT47_060930 [Sorangium cellulosum]|uniref:Uncharacterized protein n=1 Tax=Sorangium cellulosum TaxID=56 RepID=A0A4P2Q8L3_SORCE|nr:hypothetical protein [Sorangium cellulosum]AUX25546.1 uncharacterized protein SOCEGT47_060930 [Sorangium cellulosum]
MLRRSVSWLPFVLLLAGCAHRDGARNDDGFRARLARGCRSEPDCLVLQLEAKARVDRCASSCEEAEAALRASSALVARYRRQREARQAQIEARRQAGEAAEAERRRAELEAAEDARRREEAAHAAELELAASELACAQRGDTAACDALLRYLAGVAPLDPRAAQVRASHEEGQRLIAEREALRAAGESRAQEAAEAPAPARPPRAGGPRPASEGRICCCDGTLSPTCTYVKRGCCSHHGGVCACP